MKNESVVSLDAYLTGKIISTPRGSFCVVDMTRSQIVALGYGYHHMSDDYKYLIMSNGVDAYAIVA